MRAVIELDHSERSKEAIKYRSCPVDANHDLPGEHVLCWKRGLQARRKDDTEPRK